MKSNDVVMKEITEMLLEKCSNMHFNFNIRPDEFKYKLNGYELAYRRVNDNIYELYSITKIKED